MSLFSNLSTLFGPDQKRKSQQNQKSQKPKQQAQKLAENNKQAQQHQKQQKQQQPVQQKPVAVAEEVQAKAREIIVEAKAEALSIRSKAERESRDFSRQLEEQQRALNSQLDKLDERLDQLSIKEERLEKDRKDLARTSEELTKKQQELLESLEKVAELTREEAKAELFRGLDEQLTKDKARLIRQKEEEAKESADDRVKEILIDSMYHGATDFVSEYTISTVQLPSEESKGKIIGKGGRNINSFEEQTGVDVDLDASPTEVRLSCFDPVRREIARIALERLIRDGRIQPSRIEEVVAKVKKEIDKVTLEAGKNLCHELSVFNLPVELMQLIGKFKYRFSYGQNLIAHTLEETKIGIKMASELGLDVNTVKLGCLLHDIGKVSEETEGSHVELGVKIAKRFNIAQPVVDCIAQHHEDEPFSGPEQVAVYIADAISGARPGARYENYDAYVKRLQGLEEIAMKHDAVKHAYAIQAGREIRVILQPERTKDDDVTVLSSAIRDEIKNTMTYPGTVTVTVIREVRGTAVAK